MSRQGMQGLAMANQGMVGRPQQYKYTQEARNSLPAPGRLTPAPMQEQKQMLGERLFPLIQRQHADLAGKITGMLLEIDNSELLHMLEAPASLQGKVEEAVTVLQAHQVKNEAAKK